MHVIRRRQVSIGLLLFFAAGCAWTEGGRSVTVPMEAPDRPVAEGAMPSDWVEYPFVETNLKPLPSAAEDARGFVVFSRPITEPVYRETRPQAGERIERLSAFAAQGERAQLNFAVYAARELKGFKAASENPFAAELNQITYSPYKYSHYQTKGRYRVGPAYLVPAAKTDVPADTSLRYVLSVKVPSDAAPGKYAGVVRIGAEETVEIPYELTVLPFRLSRDPNKFYSAYVGQTYDVARAVEYGFNTPGTIYINYDRKAGVLRDNGVDELERKWAAAGGEKPRRYIALLNVIGTLYHQYMGKPPVKALTEMPPDAFFDDLVRMGRAFLADWRSRGKPELYVIGADEPAPTNMKYVTRVFKALKEAGFKTYVTSWSARKPNVSEALGPYVDAWCDQWFESRAELAKSGKREHWCYPNHNAYEIKDAPTMARGGRMTYGFGFWKMADSVLVPWAWSWKMDTSKIPQLALGCQVMKPDGTEWIEWEWESFFAGTVDEAYVYTLQEAILRREGGNDPVLVRRLARARDLLREIRAAIPSQRKYLATNHWPDERFDALRLRIAEMITALKRHPELNDSVCPSVLPGLEDADRVQDASSFVRDATAHGLIRRLPFPGKGFYAVEKETSCAVGPDGIVRAKIAVDHHSCGNSAGYKQGSPSLAASFKDPVDLNRYGFLSYRMRVHSNRGADDAAKWPHELLFFVKDPNGKRLNTAIHPETNVAADEWHERLYPLSGLNFSEALKRNFSVLWFYFLERDYEHGDVLEFDVSDLSLIGAEKPLVERLEVGTCRKSEGSVPWRIRLFGTLGADGVKVRFRVHDANGAVVAADSAVLRQADGKGAVRVPEDLPYGDYSLEAELLDGETAYQDRTEAFRRAGI